MNEETYLAKLNEIELMFENKLKENQEYLKQKVNKLTRELVKYRRIAHKIHLLREQKKQQEVLYQKKTNRLLKELYEIDTNLDSENKMSYGVGIMSPSAYKAYHNNKKTSYPSDEPYGEGHQNYSVYSDEVLCASPYNDKCEDYPISEESYGEDECGPDCAYEDNSEGGSLYGKNG
jgi:hypothetical protein